MRKFDLKQNFETGGITLLGPLDTRIEFSRDELIACKSHSATQRFIVSRCKVVEKLMMRSIFDQVRGSRRG